MSAIQLQFDFVRCAGCRLQRMRQRPVLVTAPDFNPRRAGRNIDIERSGRVEEPAVISKRPLPRAVAQAMQTPRRQSVFLRLVKIAVDADEVHAAVGRLAGGAIDDRHLQLRRIVARIGRWFSFARESGGSMDEGFGRRVDARSLRRRMGPQAGNPDAGQDGGE
jgi:hypothetical protein